MRKIPLAIASVILLIGAQAPMALTSSPTPQPNAKKVQLPQGQKCDINPFKFDITQPVMVRLYAPQGMYCADKISSSVFTLKSMQVDKQPKNGVVNLNEKDQRWYYRAKNGFIGEDTFVLNISGYDSRKWGATKIHVNVTVR